MRERERGGGGESRDRQTDRERMFKAFFIVISSK